MLPRKNGRSWVPNKPCNFSNGHSRFHLVDDHDCDTIIRMAYSTLPTIPLIILGVIEPLLL